MNKLFLIIILFVTTFAGTKTSAYYEIDGSKYVEPIIYNAIVEFHNSCLRRGPTNQEIANAAALYGKYKDLEMLKKSICSEEKKEAESIRIREINLEILSVFRACLGREPKPEELSLYFEKFSKSEPDDIKKAICDLPEAVARAKSSVILEGTKKGENLYDISRGVLDDTSENFGNLIKDTASQPLNVKKIIGNLKTINSEIFAKGDDAFRVSLKLTENAGKLNVRIIKSQLSGVKEFMEMPIDQFKGAIDDFKNFKDQATIKNFTKILTNPFKRQADISKQIWGKMISKPAVGINDFINDSSERVLGKTPTKVLKKVGDVTSDSLAAGEDVVRSGLSGAKEIFEAPIDLTKGTIDDVKNVIKKPTVGNISDLVVNPIKRTVDITSNITDKIIVEPVKTVTCAVQKIFGGCKKKEVITEAQATSYLTSIYNDCLGRSPEAAAKKMYTPLIIDKGQSQIRKDICASTEAQNYSKKIGSSGSTSPTSSGGVTDAQASSYLSSIYKECLGRSPGSADKKMYIQLIKSKGQSQIRKDVCASQEAKNYKAKK